jgi:hypothetical protein
MRKCGGSIEAAFSEVPALATAIQRIWAGVRDEAELCDELNFQEGAIVLETLAGRSLKLDSVAIMLKYLQESAPQIPHEHQPRHPPH